VGNPDYLRVSRGLVEGKAYVLPSDDAPAIRLTVLVLLNVPHDGT